MADLRRLLRLVAPARGWMALAALLGFATVGSGIGLLATAAFIIASAALHPSVADLAVPIVGVRFFGISRGVFRYLERYVSHSITFRLLARLRVWFYEAVEPLAPAGLQRQRSGDLLARVVADVETLQHFYVRVVAPPAVAVLVAAAVWLLFGTYAVVLANALLGLLAVAGIGVPLLAWGLGRAAGREFTAARAALNAQLVDGIQGLADLAAYGQDQAQIERVRTLNARLTAAQVRLGRTAALHGALSTLLANLATWVVLVLAIPLVAAGHLEGVFLPVLALAAAASFEAVAPLPQAFQHLSQCLASARRLFEIVAAAPPETIRVQIRPARQRRASQTSPPAGAPGPAPGLYKASQALDGGAPTDYVMIGSRPRQGFGLSRPHPNHPPERQRVPAPLLLSEERAGLQGEPDFVSTAKLDLVVRGLRFQYAPGEPLALAGVDFALPPGGHLAIVGPSGAGKSTLVNLLLRFWPYDEGSILIGGRELRAFAAEDARRLFAVVSQRTHLFNATIRENLLLARPEASEADLIRAAERAQLHDFVRQLPCGYDTWVGEQGLLLSGGERQRVAIARALLKDAPFLILDEATANLDSLTEREILRTLAALREGRSTLTITHRLVGLEDAAEILVLHGGRVVERGRHADLLARGGYYRRLWDLQRQALPTDGR